MRHRLFGSLLFLSGAALVACGGNPFEAGSQGLTGEDGGSSLTDAGADTSVTHVVGPPTTEGDAADDGASTPIGDGSSGDATLPGAPDASTDAGTPDAGPSCAANEKLCGNACVAISPSNGCEATSCTPCSLANATATCAAGVCAVETCKAGYEHCTGPASGGCETSISTASNCGSCGTVCGSSTPDCAASGSTWACTSGCPAGSQLCGTACVDTSTSTADCGGCTTGSKSYACTAPANGTATCSGGTCGFTCSSGFSECDGDKCASLTTDPSNCGTCNTVCPAPTNGTATCAAVSGVGTCGFACDSGYQQCNGACVQVDPTAAFVSASTVTTGCGSIGAPCGTIAAGMAYAASLGKTHIYIASGTYNEQVTLTNGLTLEGGWLYGGGSTWTKSCTAGVDASALSIIAPTSQSMAVVAKGVTATLTTLSIHNNATATAGESLYGIFAASTGATNTTNLTLNAVEVTVAAGGAGSTGGTAAAPALPASNATPCAIGDGKPGAAVAAGTVPASAVYGSAGFVPGAGVAGQVGNPGDNGVAGAMGGSANSSTCDPSNGGCGPLIVETGGQGGNGCGGSAGAQGLGGGGGGASIGIYVWQASVALNSGSVAAQNGGAGGGGGPGGSPATPPTTGATGTSAPVDGCTQKPAGQCTGTSGGRVAGGAGSTGGAGSNGGAGSGGAGGDSYAYYVGGGGTVTASGTPSLTFGTAGTSPAGTTYNGHAAAHN